VLLFAQAYCCRISSYLQTMANHCYNPLVAIQMALSGQLYAEKHEQLLQSFNWDVTESNRRPAD